MRITRPPDMAKPLAGGFGGADTAADCGQDRNVRGAEPQWVRATSARLVGIVNAHRRTFPGVALPCEIQVAVAREWSQT